MTYGRSPSMFAIAPAAAHSRASVNTSMTSARCLVVYASALGSYTSYDTLDRVPEGGQAWPAHRWRVPRGPSTLSYVPSFQCLFSLLTPSHRMGTYPQCPSALPDVTPPSFDPSLTVNERRCSRYLHPPFNFSSRTQNSLKCRLVLQPRLIAG